MSRGAQDAGAGSVLVLALVAVLVSAAGVFAVAVHQLGARQHARTAADLAALAGAQAYAMPAQLRLAVTAVSLDDACARATEVAERNGAGLRECRVQGAVVTVVVDLPGPLGRAAASARAGPRSARGG